MYIEIHYFQKHLSAQGFFQPGFSWLYRSFPATGQDIFEYFPREVRQKYRSRGILSFSPQSWPLFLNSERNTFNITLHLS